MSNEMAAALEENEYLRSLEYGRSAPVGTRAPESAGGASVAATMSENITLSQRMISACSGSLITSLVVTPFDVVRIRMQQQEILPSNCCEVHAAAPQANAAATTSTTASTKLTPHTLKPATPSLVPTAPPIAEAAAAAAPKTASATDIFWVSQHYCKSADNCTRINSTFEGFATISRNEGLATLWRGVSLTLFMSVPSNIIYFTGYEYIRDHSPISDHFLNPLLCGSLARMLSATFVAPLELIKTRFQAIPVEEKGNSPKMFSHLLRDSFALFRQRGVSTLFTGLQITLWRDVPFSGIYWSFYEFFKHNIGRALNAEFNSSRDDDFRVFATSFLSGSISGAIGAVMTQPFDVGKTRLQITNESSGADALDASKRPSMFRFLAHIYRNEGMGALYSGIWPRMMKIAPACAIMISSYEIGKKFFKKENSH